MKTRKILTTLFFVLFIGTVLIQTCPVFGAELGDVKWYFVTSMDPLSGVPGSPAIADDGTIYAGSLNGIFYAINPDGTLKWSFDAETPISSSPAVADDGTVYAGTGFRIFALRPNGTVKWVFEADCTFIGDMAIAKNGTIYIGSNNSKLYAITPDGEEKWTFPVPQGLNTYDPVIDQKGIIYFGTGAVGTREHMFYAVYPHGAEKWKHVYESYYGMRGSPAIGNTGLIYVPLYKSVNSDLYAFRPDGTVAWVYDNAEWGVRHPPCIDSKGTLYVPAYYLYCAVNPDGTEKWTYPIDYGSSNSPAAVGENGIIYFGSLSSYIYALYPTDASTYWYRGPTEDQVHSSPAIGDDGVMYIGCGNSVKAIYTDSYGHANSAWPMHRANPKRTARVHKFFVTMQAIKFTIKKVTIIHLPRGFENSLTSKLNSALESLKDERPRPAINKLNAFVNQVDALSGKKIPQRDADYLIGDALEIIDTIRSFAR